MTNRQKREIKVPTGKNDTQVYGILSSWKYRLLTFYMFEMIFIDKSRMYEGSYGRIEFNIWQYKWKNDAYQQQYHL